MKRTAVNVLIGLSATDGNVPATCVPLDGGKPSYGYMTSEQAEQFSDATEMHWWAEWNGVSFDLIEPMTDDDVEVASLESEEVPF